jgi:gliding motility-associated-like protein
VNDNGTTIPLRLPNDSTFLESVYNNNSAVVDYIPFTVTAIPATATLEPGDTLQLSAPAGPGPVASYLWSTAQDLSCTACDSSLFIAEKKNSTKQIIATNQYGCADTAYSIILVPPADDYTIAVDSVNCSRNDSLFIGFTLCNHFKRGIIPQGLKVSFYDADPSTAGAHLLGPVFITPADYPVKCTSFTCTVKGMAAGTLYAVVNDGGVGVPVLFPQDTLYLEKDYTNNATPFAYQPATVMLQPADTTIFRNQTIPVVIESPIYDIGSTLWFPGSGYSLSCNTCPSPLVTVTASSQVQMQTANRYGCLIKGTSNIKVFAPDMTIRILNTSCNTNNTTLVSFGICMNNFYDSIYAGIPISFYDGDPTTGRARLLTPVYYTSGILPSNCDTFTCVINSPVATTSLYAVVNDKGDNPASVPDKAFDETNYTNNTDKTVVTPFVASVTPVDTTIFRLTNVQVVGTVTGGSLGSSWWEPTSFLSCSNCAAPVVTPPYSMKYAFIAENEHACFDTVFVDIKTFAGGSVDIPNAFTPNADGHNDVFYVMGNKDIKLLKDFSVFNRWGQKVFQVSNAPANDPAYGWNGKMPNGQAAEEGTYVYYVMIVFGDGHSQLFKGTVTLLH